MRLSILDHGHRLRARLFMGLTAKMSRVDSPDVVRMLMYRPGFFARALLDLAVPAMRGPSFWTAGEREYLAMRIAQRLRCPFCEVSHTEMTRLAGRGEVDPTDPGSARPELREIDSFLDRPGPVSLPGEAVAQALRVALVWDIVNRLGNAFGFTLRPGQLASGTKSLHRFGYRFPGFLLAGGQHTDQGDVVANLRYAVFDAPAATRPALRKSAADGSIAEHWHAYAELVRDHSYRVTDEDVSRLRESHSEDEIFEVTVAAAVGAALHDFDTRRRAVAA